MIAIWVGFGDSVGCNGYVIGSAGWVVCFVWLDL